ncbi:MAG TPA: hypothetical protein VFE17_11735 [Candidatus Baltobacteraceae bacterium]|jgi:hypothetical protein|nr:hypothetical protein [Candidatus Baltobacteraceae bacterium]
MQVQRFGAVLTLAAIALTGCGGGNKASNTSTTTSTTTQSSPAAAPASPAAAAASPGAMHAMQGSVAPVPSTLHCGAVQPVWVNPRSHVYHEPSDPRYGRTRHGKYMCPSQAVAAGYHAAGSGSGSYGKHHHRSSGAMAPASPAGAPSSP